MALETRPDREPPEQERLRNAVLVIQEQGKLRLIGKFEEHVRESFELLSNRQQLSARDLAELRELSLSAASTRLKTLADLGLAVRVELRDEQGKQYMYQSLS
jgi:hypothetical protein